MTLTPSFVTGVLKPIAQGQDLVPRIRAWLTSGFPGVTVTVPAFTPREPDFHFHPSTHPLWPERALWLWMVAPGLLEAESPSAEMAIAVTAGHFWHEVVQEGMVRLKIVPSRDYIEVGLSDPLRPTRGRADGMREGEIVEIKTMDPRAHRNISTVDEYIAKKPGYYAQALEYMRMAGLERERVILVSLVYPFEMSEFVIPFDRAASLRITDKYDRVLDAIDIGTPPMCSGCLASEQCPARFVCSSGVDVREAVKKIRDTHGD